MPDGEEAVVEEQGIVNLLDPEFQEEIALTLTKGQALFIFRILEANIAPRGLQMVEFAYDLMKRFDPVTSLIDGSKDSAPERKEAFVSEETVEEKPKVYKDNVLQED